MSRAFVKEDAAGEDVLVPPRAPLPVGVANLVTPRGLRLLREERAALQAERATLESSSAAEATRHLAAVTGRLEALEARLASAQAVDPRAGPAAEVRLGRRVTLRSETGRTLRFTLVGVDEADPPAGRIAFTAPTAAAVLGRSLGEQVRVTLAGAERRFVVTEVAVDEAA